jgi:hypothetical protein
VAASIGAIYAIPAAPHEYKVGPGSIIIRCWLSHHTPEYMAKKSPRTSSPTAAQSPYDEARDELFQHIMRCGVIGAAPEHQEEWFDDTIKYLTERYPELNEKQLTELRTLGMRFAQPPKRQPQGTPDAVSAA